VPGQAPKTVAPRSGDSASSGILERPFDLRITENIEAIAVSIAMALVLKFFVIEAYQIPTGSMQPNILGDRVTGIKDRVLADKLITMLRPPQRWEVMIFRFPLDERRLYVKRIVGLPDETLEVIAGDIWIDGHIARKPDHVNESVLKHITTNGEPMDIGRWFTAGTDIDVSGTTARFGSDPESRLVLRKHVFDDYLHGYDKSWGLLPAPGGDHAVTDLDVTLTATMSDASQSLVITFEAAHDDTVFVLPAEGSTEEPHVLIRPLDGDPTILPMPKGLRLPRGEAVEVLARRVDHALLLEVDGETWLRFEDDTSLPERAPRRRARVALAMPTGGQLEDVEVRRDIFYLPRTRNQLDGRTGKWEIPAQHYFGMGDNTQASHDSRTWMIKTYVLKDGREISGFDFGFSRHSLTPVPPDANPRHLPNRRLAFADVHGDTTLFSEQDVVSTRTEYAPFIHERYLLGKAGLVFWPAMNPFRWKLIR
jgi:signal peptidase I